MRETLAVINTERNWHSATILISIYPFRLQYLVYNTMYVRHVLIHARLISFFWYEFETRNVHRVFCFDMFACIDDLWKPVQVFVRRHRNSHRKRWVSNETLSVGTNHMTRKIVTGGGFNDCIIFRNSPSHFRPKFLIESNNFSDCFTNHEICKQENGVPNVRARFPFA